MLPSYFKVAGSSFLFRTTYEAEMSPNRNSEEGNVNLKSVRLVLFSFEIHLKVSDLMSIPDASSSDNRLMLRLMESSRSVFRMMCELRFRTCR